MSFEIIWPISPAGIFIQTLKVNILALCLCATQYSGLNTPMDYILKSLYTLVLPVSFLRRGSPNFGKLELPCLHIFVGQCLFTNSDFKFCTIKFKRNGFDDCWIVMEKYASMFKRNLED